MLQKEAKNLSGFIAFLLSSGESYGEGGCANRLSLTQKPFATDAADVGMKNRSICKDRLAERRVEVMAIYEMLWLARTDAHMSR